MLSLLLFSSPLHFPQLPSSLLLAPSVARQLIAMNLNCCIHSPALAAVKKQQQKPETNGVLIFSRSCQSPPPSLHIPLSLPPPLRHASAVKSAGVQGRLHSFLGQEAPRHLHKIWSLQTERTPCVCVCVCHAPPAHVWVATVGCVCRLSIKKWNKSQMALPSPRPEKYASVFVFYSYNNKSTVAASSGTVTAKTTAAAVAVSSSPPPPLPLLVVVALF